MLHLVTFMFVCSVGMGIDWTMDLILSQTRALSVAHLPGLCVYDFDKLSRNHHPAPPTPGLFGP